MIDSLDVQKFESLIIMKHLSLLLHTKTMIGSEIIGFTLGAIMSSIWFIYDRKKKKVFEEAKKDLRYKEYQVMNGKVSVNEPITPPFEINNDGVIAFSSGEYIATNHSVEYGRLMDQYMITIQHAGKLSYPVSTHWIETKWDSVYATQLLSGSDVLKVSDSKLTKVVIDPELFKFSNNSRYEYNPQIMHHIHDYITLPKYPERLTNIRIGFWGIKNNSEQFLLIKSKTYLPYVIKIGSESEVLSEFRKVVGYYPWAKSVSILVAIGCIAGAIYEYQEQVRKKNK